MNITLEREIAALVKFFNITKTKYAILGGVAVLLYGEPRLTLDIDVAISIDKNNIEEFLKIGKKYGFYPISKKLN